MTKPNLDEKRDVQFRHYRDRQHPGKECPICNDQPPAKPRVYRVYDDSDDGKMVYVTAKNRKEARRVAGITSTHVTWCPWLKWVNGQAIDEWGRVQENRL